MNFDPVCAEYRVLPYLDATSHGPRRMADDGSDGDLVHLRQGDADGACGPYCLLMGLLALGLAKRDDVIGWGKVDGRTNVGKLIRRMSEQRDALFHEGSDLANLELLLRDLYKGRLQAVSSASSGRACKQFVEDQVRDGAPVVLGLMNGSVAHWVLVIGVDAWHYRDGTRRANRFLLLDPSIDAVAVAPWNSVVDLTGSGGPYPYQWWPTPTDEPVKVAFDCALALQPV